MKIGVLGSGFMGGTHARAYAKLDGVDVTHVSSRSLDKAQALADEVGAQATSDDMAIIHDPSIDVVSITLPTHLHREYTIAALQAGKHILLEKPFGLTVEDCDAIMAVHAETDRLLMVAHVIRFWPEYIKLVEVVQSGVLGKPLSAVATRLSVPPGWADWFHDPALSGGAVLDLSVHDFDAVNWVMGAPMTIYARGQQVKPGLWHHVNAIIDYGGAQAVVEGSEILPADYPFTCSLKVLCEGGSIEFMFQAGGVSVEMEGINSLVMYEPGKTTKLQGEPGDLYENQIAYFVDCVRQGKTPAIGTPEQARLGVKMANAAVESMQSGNVVTL